MRELLKVLLIVFTVGTLNFCCSPTLTELVKNGQSEFTIIIPPNPGEQEKRAADLLRKYIKEMSGYELRVASELKSGLKGIFITEVSGLNYDGYRIKTEKNGSVYIDGGKTKGCIYGVIAILDTYLGCHLYSPTFKIIPRKKYLSIPFINISDSSFNASRMTTAPKEVTDDNDLVDWMRLTPLNILNAGNMFESLVPREKFFASHPEYFSMIDGIRTPDQLCPLKEEVLKIAIEKMKTDVAAKPESKYWTVMQNDGPYYCQCDKCKKAIAEEKSPSGPIIRFVNGMAKAFPEKTIVTLAYFYSLNPPVITKPADNIMIVLCSNEVGRSMPIAQDTTLDSRKFLGYLERWGNITKNICVWDYATNYWYTISPYPNFHNLQPNMQLFKQNNVNNQFQQADLNNGSEFANLRLYLLSKLMWNPNIDFNAEMTRFMLDYYGSAAVWIKKYIEQAEAELLKSGVRLRFNTSPEMYKDSYLKEKDLADYTLYFDNAEKAVQNDSVLLNHVQVARLPLSFAYIDIGMHNLYGSRGFWDSTGLVRNKKMDAILENFVAVCKKEGINSFDENSQDLQNFCDMTKFVTSNEAAVGNLAFHKKVSSDLPLNGEHKYFTPKLTLLTDGIRGDRTKRKLYWIGWKGVDLNLTVDLEAQVKASTVDVGSFWAPRPCILHPKAVECFVSNDANSGFVSVGRQELKGDQLKEDYRHVYSFKVPSSITGCRYIRLQITSMKVMPITHARAGMKASVFLDEIVVK